MSQSICFLRAQLPHLLSLLALLMTLISRLEVILLSFASPITASARVDTSTDKARLRYDAIPIYILLASRIRGGWRAHFREHALATALELCRILSFRHFDYHERHFIIHQFLYAIKFRDAHTNTGEMRAHTRSRLSRAEPSTLKDCSPDAIDISLAHEAEPMTGVEGRFLSFRRYRHGSTAFRPL